MIIVHKMNPYIKKLLKKQEQNDLNEKEIAILDLWYLRQIAASQEKNTAVPKQEMWDKICRRTPPNPHKEIIFKYVAAACLLFFVALSFLVYFSDKKVGQPNGSDILGVENKNIQVDGITIKPANIKHNQSLRTPNGIVFKNDLGKIEYTIQHITKETTVHTTKSQSISINLLDGSKIWLDQLSSLTILPTESSRLIELDGDAYFEVRKNLNPKGENIPFIVNSHSLQVQVLGTKFSVNSRKNNTVSTATLVDGSVRVKAHATNLTRTLKPLESAIINNGKISIQKSSQEKGEEIKNDVFVFEDEPLTLVLEKFSKWYDVELKIIFPEKENELISGRISKNKSLEATLKDLENVTNTKIKLIKNTVTVK